MFLIQNTRLPPDVNKIIFVKCAFFCAYLYRCSSSFRNLPYKISPEELYDIFGKFGAIRQIRMSASVIFFVYSNPYSICRRGNAKDTKGTGFVIYEDIMDAKTAVEHLTGFNVGGRFTANLFTSFHVFDITRASLSLSLPCSYLTVLYYQPNKVTKKMDLEKKRQELEELKAKFGVDASAPVQRAIPTGNSKK